VTRADLLALAARVEAATGADRELDREIDRALFPQYWRRSETGSWFSNYVHRPPAFTASLDAAASLVPEGWAYHIAVRPWFDVFQAKGSVWAFGQRVASFTASAATPALALTAAALRALAQEVGDE